MKKLILTVLGLLILLPMPVLADQVTCESVQNRRQECDMDTRGNVRLVRQLSKSDCREGQTWGYSKHSIWVDRGCRATFESDGGGSYQQPHNSEPTSAQIRACNAVRDWYGEVVSFTALKPGAFEIILDYARDGKYVCNVEANGRVTYFERLNNQ